MTKKGRSSKTILNVYAPLHSILDYRVSQGGATTIPVPP
jgi:hypothetical protein